jgi:hypothetical protein
MIMDDRKNLKSAASDAAFSIFAIMNDRKPMMLSGRA